MNPIFSESFVSTFATEAAADLTLRQAASQIPTSPSLAGRLASTVVRAIHQVVDPRGFAFAEAKKAALPARKTITLAPIVTLQPHQPEATELDLAA